MTEPQVRGTDNEAAEKLREWLHPDYRPDLDAALDWERRRTVDGLIESFGAAHDPYCAYERYPGSHTEPPDPCTCGFHFLQDQRAALDPDTLGEEDPA